MATKGESARRKSTKKKSTKKTVDIHIYEHGDDGPQMEPGHAVVERGGKLRWENLTDDEVLLVLPTAKLFAPPTSELKVKSGDAEALTVLPNARRGGYVYMAVRRPKVGTMRLVRGGSNPVIVIR